jgi:nucleoside-diphosphate-sugar epimerase
VPDSENVTPVGPSRTALVTGGSGYFGLLMVQELRRRGYQVRVLDLNDADDRPADVELVQGDIRDAPTVRRALDGVDVVFHNVAQVPLAKDPDAFESVNVGGTQVLLDACRDLGVGKVVSTSSSAIFGIPRSNPVTETTVPSPAEAYGQAKFDAERLCRDAAGRGLDVTIIRPRTILGFGRLGIFTVLFDWIEAGTDVFVLGKGDNRYQFVHARDLADACIRAGERPGPEIYNIGARDFGTMREALEALAAHAGTGSRVRSLPVRPAGLAMQLVSKAGLAPFAAYHWIMYSKSMWFDTTKAQTELGWTSTASNEEMLIETYDWYLANRAAIGGESRSHHRSPVREGALRVARWGLSLGRKRV